MWLSHPPRSKYHVTGPPEPTGDIATVLLSDLFPPGLICFPPFLGKITKQNLLFCWFIEKIEKKFCRPLGRNTKCIIFLQTPRMPLFCFYESVFDLIILLQLLHCSCMKKLKNNLWKAAQRSGTDCSEYNLTQRNGFSQQNSAQWPEVKGIDRPAEGHGRASKKSSNLTGCLSQITTTAYFWFCLFSSAFINLFMYLKRNPVFFKYMMFNSDTFLTVILLNSVKENNRLLLIFCHFVCL